MNTKDKIRKLITNSLTVEHLAIEDLSHLHQGHQGSKEHGGGHFQIIVVSDDFDDLPLVKRHRLINDVVMKALESEIHALGIKALTKREYEINE